MIVQRIRYFFVLFLLACYIAGILLTSLAVARAIL